ncbi:NAD(P)H-binding protein [Candidatus Saccharibacteria bacterium]|nr:NAD(P)H-binding protein [Candidatus Saccharibacteria bacterium]
MNTSTAEAFCKKILEDGEKHIKLLKNSDLDWTVLRSPIMNDQGNPENYGFSGKKTMPWSTINRESVAICLVELVREQGYTNQLPYIKRT